MSVHPLNTTTVVRVNSKKFYGIIERNLIPLSSVFVPEGSSFEREQVHIKQHCVPCDYTCRGAFSMILKPAAGMDAGNSRRHLLSQIIFHSFIT
jgi:hypothetical protein